MKARPSLFSAMCPLWPLHMLLIYALMLLPILFVTCKAADLGGSFNPAAVTVQMESMQSVQFDTTDCQLFEKGDPHFVSDSGQYLIQFNDVLLQDGTNGTHCWGMFNVTGTLLGKVLVRVKDKSGKQSVPLPVTIIREVRVIDSVFTYSVAILVSIIYINFGCVLDWEVLKQTIKRPIGPIIGFCCQFVLMPLISFGLGKWIFPDSTAMQLGLFFTGLSPAGGASNIWSVALEANVNLSVTMTTISTIAAFAMFPFWLFTLGDHIFAQADMATPYQKVAEYVFCLVVPLIIGLLSQKYLPRFSRLMVRILKPFSIFLILFIIIFATVTNTYIFDLFTWKIAAAGIGLPWLGYFGGFLAALALRQPMKDVLAIAVETGVQNTGIAIFMLRFSLDQPDADLTTVIPVSVSLMTPIPLLILFIYIKIRNRHRSKMSLDKETMLQVPETDLKEVNGNGYYRH